MLSTFIRDHHGGYQVCIARMEGHVGKPKKRRRGCFEEIHSKGESFSDKSSNDKKNKKEEATEQMSNLPGRHCSYTSYQVQDTIFICWDNCTDCPMSPQISSLLHRAMANKFPNMPSMQKPCCWRWRFRHNWCLIISKPTNPKALFRANHILPKELI